MQTPVFTIASNAGVEGAVVVGKLLEQDNPDLGYDAAKGLLLHFNSFVFLYALCFFHQVGGININIIIIIIIVIMLHSNVFIDPLLT